MDYVCEGCELPVEEDETIGDQEAEKIVLDSSISVDNNFKVEDNNSKTEEVKKKVENDDVIVEDENVKIQDEASSKEKNVKKSEDKKTKKKTEKKPENKEAKKDEKTTGESTDPISLLIGRVQGNLKRVRMLSLEIGGAISLGVRSGKWESFKKIVQDPGFVKKYWILFVFIFTIGYTIVSTILSLYPDTKAKARASGSAKKKSSSKSEKRSKSRSTGTIEVKDE